MEALPVKELPRGLLGAVKQRRESLVNVFFVIKGSSEVDVVWGDVNEPQKCLLAKIKG